MKIKTKIVYGLKYSLTIVRKTDDDAIFRDAWQMLEKSLLIKFHGSYLALYPLKSSIYKTIESKSKLPVAYRTRHCDMFSVSQLTNKFHMVHECKTLPENEIYHCWNPMAKDGDQAKNPSIFDHINLENVIVMLILDRYLAIDYHLSCQKPKFSRAYSDAAMFGVKFFGMDEFITQWNITSSDNKKNYILLS